MMQATNKMQQSLFIDLFKSALHVSGDKQPQECFLTVYTALVQFTDIAASWQQYRCIVS